MVAEPADAPGRRADDVRRARRGPSPRPAGNGDPPPVGGSPDRAGPPPLRRYPARPGGPDPGDPDRHGLLPTTSRDARHAGVTRRRRTPRASGGIVMTTDRDPRTRIVLSWLREEA